MILGMAILFKLSDGEEWRTAMTDIPVFTVKSAQGFHDQLLALAPDPATGKPDPAKMNAFFAKYPESAKAMQLTRSHPVSSGFENSTYNSLNAFRSLVCITSELPVIRAQSDGIPPLASAPAVYRFGGIVLSQCAAACV